MREVIGDIDFMSLFGSGAFDPLLMAECFVRDFRYGLWDEFDDGHVSMLCDTLLEKLATDNIYFGDDRDARKVQVGVDILDIIFAVNCTE